MRALLRRLDRHWFTPASLRDLAIVRICLVGAQLFLFTPSLDRQLWQLGLSDELWNPLPVLKIMMLPFGGWGARPEPILIQAVFVVGLVSGLSALVGLATRVSLFWFAAANTFLIVHGYSYGETHHTQTMLILALWILSLGPRQTRLSVDGVLMRIRAKRAGRWSPDHEVTESVLARWPLRVIQWCLALMYLSAGFSKLEYGGLAWFNGYTLEYHVMKDTLLENTALGQQFAALPTTVLSGISIGAVVFELSFFLVVLYPRLVWPFLLGGWALHTGIYLTQKAPFFHLMFAYIVFIESLRMTFPFRRRFTERPSSIATDEA